MITLIFKTDKANVFPKALTFYDDDVGDALFMLINATKKQKHTFNYGVFYEVLDKSAVWDDIANFAGDDKLFVGVLVNNETDN